MRTTPASQREMVQHSSADWLDVDELAARVDESAAALRAGRVAAARRRVAATSSGPQVPEATWRELLTEAGFGRFRRATETPFNRVFEARP